MDACRAGCAAFGSYVTPAVGALPGAHPDGRFSASTPATPGPREAPHIALRAPFRPRPPPPSALGHCIAAAIEAGRYKGEVPRRHGLICARYAKVMNLAPRLRHPRRRRWRSSIRNRAHPTPSAGAKISGRRGWNCCQDGQNEAPPRCTILYSDVQERHECLRVAASPHEVTVDGTTRSR